MRPAEPGSRRWLRHILLGHVLLVCCFGSAYAKASLPVVGLYPTELVVLCTVLLSGGLSVALVRDKLTAWTLIFVAIGLGWTLVAGVGPLDGPGPKALSFFAYAVFFFALRNVLRDEGERSRLLMVIAMAALAGAGLGLWRMQTGSLLLAPRESFEITTTGSSRWLDSGFALYGIFACLIIGTKAISSTRLSRSEALVLFAGLIEIILTQHRSAFVALAIAVISAMVLSGSSRRVAQILTTAIGALVFLITLFVWVLGSTYLDDTLQRIADTTNLEDANVAWRILSWQEVITGIKEHPMGHGFAQWDFFFTMHDPLTGSHNSFLDLTYRVGLPGAAALLALPVLLFARTKRAVRLHGADRCTAAIAACGCLVGLLVFSMFNVVLETPYMSIFFWVFLGTAAAALDDLDRNATLHDPSTPRRIDPSR